MIRYFIFNNLSENLHVSMRRREVNSDKLGGVFYWLPASNETSATDEFAMIESDSIPLSGNFGQI